jgi:hypothetical protein
VKSLVVCVFPWLTFGSGLLTLSFSEKPAKTSNWDASSVRPENVAFNFRKSISTRTGRKHQTLYFFLDTWRYSVGRKDLYPNYLVYGVGSKMSSPPRWALMYFLGNLFREEGTGY